MRVLYLASRPADEATLRLEDEIGAVQAALQPGAEKVRLEVHPQLTLDRLPLVLAAARADVLHISAHAEAGRLLFTDEYGDASPLSGELLADLLGAVRARPRLILVNACTSAELLPPLAAAADFVVGVTAPVSNQSARAMAAVLYARLADGATVTEAFTAARVILAAGSQGAVEAKLVSTPGSDPDAVRLCEPLRLIACLPALDEALKASKRQPPNLLKGGAAAMEFGIAGAPGSTVQVVIFTDDESFVGEPDDLESDLAWIKRDRPVAGVIWLDAEGEASGDCRWYASAVTADGRVHSTAATLVEALTRYYLDEAWPGPLPPGYEAAVRETLAWLTANDGSRRQNNRVKRGR